MLNTAENLVTSGLAAGGVLTSSALFSFTMTAIMQALPMIQAVLLLGIYALLPVVVVLSRYSISVMVIGTIAIFTVKFWSVLWHLALLVDQNLIMSMYPDVNIFLQFFDNTSEHDINCMLLNMITTSLYLDLPLLWSGMMAWAGQLGRNPRTKVSDASSGSATPHRTSGKNRYRRPEVRYGNYTRQ